MLVSTGQFAVSLQTDAARPHQLLIYGNIFLSFSASNITIGSMRSGINNNNTLTVDISVSSKAELDKLLESKASLEASNV
jgi:hypothetical protein